MILAALAAAALAASPPSDAAPPNGSATVAPLTVRALPPGTPPAATVEVPTDDTQMGQWASIWPADAYKEHLAGHVVLSCDIDVHGLAEWCQVASERPAGKGFGAAALELRPTFKVKPATGPDGAPIEAVMNIAVEFKPPLDNVNSGAMGGGGSTEGGMSRGVGGTAVSFGGPALMRRPVSMLNNPVWASTVGYDDVRRAYPAKGQGAEGYAVAHCEVARNGSLSGCQAIKEDPDNRGFGLAAIKLASRFRVARPWTTAPDHGDVWVDIPFRFLPPGAPDDRTVNAPYWIAGFNPDQALKVFPAEAAAQGLTTGSGVARCQVAADGALTDCAPERADPEGLGFSEAAAKLVSTMRMNPWTSDGRPVDGAMVTVSVRLNLKPES